MDFSELTNEVFLITKRPDLLSLTESAIRASSLKAHQKDFFYRDIVETGVAFTQPANYTTFEPKAVLPKYRAPAYVREWKYDPSNVDQGKPGIEFDSVETGNARDAYGFYKQNVYYMAGNMLQIRSAIQLSHILLGAYVYPDITPTTYNSWIAEDFPWAIIHDAARSVLYSIGAMERASKQEALTAEQYSLLTINSIGRGGN